MEQPFFSVIIPTYNRAALLNETLESFQDQTFTHFEVIVVDDGGSDHTFSVVSQMNDGRFKYYWKENEERCIARRYGLTMAQGEYINYFDSDDWAYPNHLEAAYQLIQTQNSLAFFALSYDTGVSRNAKAVTNIFLKGDISATIYENNPLSINGVFLRKDIALQYQFPLTKISVFGEDLLVWLRIAEQYPLLCYPVISSRIRQHDNRSMISIDDKQLWEAYSFIKEELNDSGGESRRRNLKRLKSSFYSYNALLATERKEKLSAIRNLLYSLYLNPRWFFYKRPYAILKNLLIR